MEIMNNGYVLSERDEPKGVLWVCVLLKVHPSVSAQVKFWRFQSEARRAVKFMLRTSEVRLVIPSTTPWSPSP